MFVSGIFRGLCVTCGNNTICTYERNAGQPVTDCLEFEPFPMSRPMAQGGNMSPLAKSWVRRAEEAYAGEPGLCGTCNGREGCVPEANKSACVNYR